MQLVVTLPDQARIDAASTARWMLIDAAGSTMREGAGTIDTLPRAPQTIALVPARRVVFIETSLPPASVPQAKRDQLVRYAIEDKLTIDPSTVHAVVLDRMRGSDRNHIVAAIDRTWFAATLQWLLRAGISPRSVFAETALLPVVANEWSVKLGERQAYARRSDGFAYALDATNTDEPPFGLTLALNEVKEKPAAIALYADHAISPNLATTWQNTLGLPVRISNSAGARKSLATLKGNLLTGEFAPAKPARAWVAAAKPALILAAAIVALQGIFTTIDFWQMDRKRVALERDMRATFQATFPQATAIVDPALQMRRNLDALKRERGLVSEDDPRPALARLASITAGARELVIADVSIKDGKATLIAKLAPNADATMASLQEKVAATSGASLRAGAVGTVEISVRVGS